MQRTRRASRFLFAALAIIITLGLGFYLLHVHRTRALGQVALVPPHHYSIIVPDNSASAPQTQPAMPMLAASTVTPGPSSSAQSDISADTLVTTTPPISLNAVAQNAPTTRPVALLAADTSQQHAAAPPPLTASTTALSVPAGDVLNDARAKKTTGDLLSARDELNNTLISGHLSEADADATRHSIADINQTLIFSPQRTPNDPWVIAYPVQSGEHLSTIAGKNSVTWQLLSRINHTDPKHLRSGSTIKVLKGPFFAVVTKSKFRMDIYLGGPGGPDSMYVTSFAVGLGKNDSTPTGTWQVQSGNKILKPRYYSPENQGVIDAEDPKNPLGGYWIGLEGVDGQAVDKHSYGIHGTIDPDSIGKQASMGCIRMGHEDIDLTFALLVEVKSKVLINP